MAEVTSHESQTEPVAFTVSLPDGGSIAITPGQHTQDHLSDLSPEQRKRVVDLLQEMIEGKFDMSTQMLFMVVCTLSHAEAGEIDQLLDLLEEPVVPMGYSQSMRSPYGRMPNGYIDSLFAGFDQDMEVPVIRLSEPFGGSPFDDLVATSPFGEPGPISIDSLLSLVGITPELLATLGDVDAKYTSKEEDNPRS